MLLLAVVLLVGSVAAGAFGFTGASGGRTVAKIASGVFLLAFLLLVLLTFGGAS